MAKKRPRFLYPKPVMPGWVYADDSMGRHYCFDCGRRLRDKPAKGDRCPKCGCDDLREIRGSGH